MTIFNLGSINIDRAYSLDHIVAPGETASASALRESPGGKGFNQSIALARAGARVRHIGAIGTDGAHLVAMLRQAGADTAAIASVAESNKANSPELRIRWLFMFYFLCLFHKSKIPVLSPP